MTRSLTSLRVQEIENLVGRAPRAALAAAEAWLNEANPSVDVVLRQRVRLARAGAQNRLGDDGTSGRVMREINAWAVEHEDPWLRANSHRLLANLFARLGDIALALEHAVSALAGLPDEVPPLVRSRFLMCLADALGSSGSFEQSLRRYEEAGALADVSGDVHQRMVLLNNLTYTYYQAGDGVAAVSTAERLMAVIARHGLQQIQYYDTIARAYMLVGRFDEAVQLLAPRVHDDIEWRVKDCDGLAGALLTLAKIHRMAGGLDEAQAVLDRASERHDHYQLVGLGTGVLREQAALHAARGRFQEAYEVFTAYHEADGALRAVEREARARTLQGLYEANEARRDSARFRELAARDPLTGLSNRRYVDEHLVGLLLQSTDADSPMTLALLDLDHFKSVNDLRSHDVGDTVLREVASLLERGVADVPESIVARLGGEEFLLALPGLDVSDASALLDVIRRSIADHDWDPVTSGVPVTISIGTATLPHDGTERATLLHLADDRLYGAKRRGRNQVVDRDTVDVVVDTVDHHAQ